MSNLVLGPDQYLAAVTKTGKFVHAVWLEEWPIHVIARGIWQHQGVAKAARERTMCSQQRFEVIEDEEGLLEITCPHCLGHIANFRQYWEQTHCPVCGRDVSSRRCEHVEVRVKGA